MTFNYFEKQLFLIFLDHSKKMEMYLSENKLLLIDFLTNDTFIIIFIEKKCQLHIAKEVILRFETLKTKFWLKFIPRNPSACDKKNSFPYLKNILFARRKKLKEIYLGQLPQFVFSGVAQI